MSTLFPLAKPILIGDEEITELELRELSGDDIISIGFPYLIVMGDDDNQSLELRPKIIAKYVSKLAAVPPSVVGKMTPADISKITGVVMSFFGVEPEMKKASQSEPSN